MAQDLHSQKMWEELAEDPFRGLRAGPATFSPFLFLPTSESPNGLPLNSKKPQKWRFRIQCRSAPTEEKAKRNKRDPLKWKNAER